METSAKIYVAGHRGMVGSAICRELKRQGYEFVTIRDIFKKSGVKPEHNVVYMSVDEVRENYR